MEYPAKPKQLLLFESLEDYRTFTKSDQNTFNRLRYDYEMKVLMNKLCKGEQDNQFR